MQRLPEDDAPCGKTREELAADHKQRCREREKRRRERVREQLQKVRREPENDLRVFVPIQRFSGTSDDDWHRRVERGPDNRSLTSRIAGDPLPGQSALDRRTRS